MKLNLACKCGDLRDLLEAFLEVGQGSVHYGPISEELLELRLSCDYPFYSGFSINHTISSN